MKYDFEILKPQIFIINKAKCKNKVLKPRRSKEMKLAKKTPESEKIAKKLKKYC